MKTIFKALGLCMALAAGIMASAQHGTAGPADRERMMYKYESGTCDNGKSWWTVTCFLDGKPTNFWGVDCKGVGYWKAGVCWSVESDPTTGMTPTFTGDGDNGVIWHAVLKYNEDNRLIWAGGQDAGGAYWAMDLDWSQGTGLEDAPPLPGVH